MKNIRQNRPKTIKFIVQKAKKDIASRLSPVKTRVSAFVNERPVFSFFGFLALLLVVILIGEVLRAPKESKEDLTKTSKSVNVVGIGGSPKLSLSGKVEKSGVILIVSQAAGVVQSINVQEGSKVGAGTWLVGLASNYQGWNISSLSRSLAQKNLELVNSNFQPQLELIAKQRDLADKVSGSAGALRDIANSAIGDTQTLIAVNQDMLTSIQSVIDTLPPTSTDSAIMATIIQMKQAKSGVLSGLLALQTQLRNAQYQADGDHEPAKIASLTKDMTLQQLDIQERSVRIGKEIAELNLKIAQASEAFMYPSAPIAGVVERVHVSIGQPVSPGTPLVTVTGSKNTATVIVSVSRTIAQSLSRLEASTLTFAGKSVTVFPRYISTEPTDGSLFSILYTIPDEFGSFVADGESVRVDVPVAKEMTNAAVPFIPLDSVYQTQDAAYVYVASPSADGTFLAKSVTVTLGEVVGSYVRVASGLTSQDQVIINRSVVDGDLVTLQ